MVVAEVFSMPPKMKSATVTWEYLAHGYGAPIFSVKNRIILGVLPKARRVSSSRPGGE